MAVGSRTPMSSRPGSDDLVDGHAVRRDVPDQAHLGDGPRPRPGRDRVDDIHGERVRPGGRAERLDRRVLHGQGRAARRRRGAEDGEEQGQHAQDGEDRDGNEIAAGHASDVSSAPLGAPAPSSHRNGQVAAARRRNSARSALPEPRRGRRSSRSTFSGVLKVAIPRPANQRRHSSRSNGAADSTNAATRSPIRGSGYPTATAWWTSGCASSAASTSEAEMFSPPRMITSLSRPTMRTHPSVSTVARSPVRNQPPGAMTVAVWTASA